MFHQVGDQEDKINTMARYKKYKHGGKKVPGMYAQDGVETNPVPPQRQSLNERPMIQAQGSGRANLSPQEMQAMQQAALENQRMRLQSPKQMQAMQQEAVKMQEQQQIMQIVQQMKLQNDSLLQQNELLKTQIQKSDTINSARNTKQTSGAANSPKKYGGGNKKRVIFSQSGSGNIMKRGGSCLPGGAHSRRKR